jgi:hypothetical protein
MSFRIHPVYKNASSSSVDSKDVVEETYDEDDVEFVVDEETGEIIERHKKDIKTKVTNVKQKSSTAPSVPKVTPPVLGQSMKRNTEFKKNQPNPSFM